MMPYTTPLNITAYYIIVLHLSNGQRGNGKGGKGS